VGARPPEDDDLFTCSGEGPIGPAAGTRIDTPCDPCHILSVNLSDSRTAGQPAESIGAQPLARLSAAEAVFNAIRADIESGQVPVGGKLSSEATLSQQYGVSRSVIREALRSCTALGLTVTKTGKGTFVVANKVANDLTLGQYSARDLTEARPHIEIPAAGLAARRRTHEELETLRHIVAAMTTETDPESWVALDSSFHAAIARASGNKVFASVVADIRGALAFQSETLNMVADRQHASDIEHQQILAAIEAGSAEAASNAMAEHLRAVGVALDSILNK
jgi:GntR family transcriptional regulator, transcriptional repressor for pyruvate dehydrogenase complex